MATTAERISTATAAGGGTTRYLDAGLPFDDARIAAYLTDAQYAPEQIAHGLAYADQQGATDPDERLTLALSRILYTDADLRDGVRFHGGMPTYPCCSLPAGY